MNGVAQRLLEERAFHDQQAHARARDLHSSECLRFSDDLYLDHESWIRPAFARFGARFGTLEGRAILDFGCGHGMASVVLARRGAQVTALDLSLGYLQEVQRRARANEVSLRCVCADGERLPFPERCFDGIWGNAILHHLELDRALSEIRRVLRPGGVAVFCEPWGGNPILEWARRRLPYTNKSRTPEECPLQPRQLAILRHHFPQVQVEGQQFLSMLRRVSRVARQPHLLRILESADHWLLRQSPVRHWVNGLCRYVILTLAG